MTERSAFDHERNTELLNAELPDTRFQDASYLRWLYDENPVGPGFHDSVDEDGRRMAHYAVIPQEYRCADGPARMVFSLNAVTRSGAQRKGWFTTLGERVYARGAEWGALGVVGVSNVNSTPPVVKKLDFRLLGPLPVRVFPAAGPTVPIETHAVDAAFLASVAFDEWAHDLDDFPVEGWVNRWTPTYLRWRLAAPNMTHPYRVHASADLAAITVRDRLGPVPVTVVVKLLPRGGAAGRGPLDGHPLIRAVCRADRSPVALHAGYNRHVRVQGVAPPRRFLPAPLNLIYRSESPAAPKETFAFDIFEFLDMDGY
jgi:hypothetical protein